MTIEYELEKKVMNADFITSKMKNANKLIIRYDPEGSILEIKSKNDYVIYEIPLENIKDAYVVYQRRYQDRDKLIQIVFTEGTEHIRIIRVNIRDSEIDGLIHKINELKRKDKEGTPLKICSDCGSKSVKESKFCNQCGRKLQSPCLECGNINPEDSTFCPHCGSRLDKD
jgi:ribosomal protein L40E